MIEAGVLPAAFANTFTGAYMTTDTHAARLDFACQLAEAAGEKALDYFRDLGSLTIESKGHQDLVSEADRAVEQFIRKAIAGRFAEDGIVGEEFGHEAGSSGCVWVIDPIDGTTNFLSSIPAWTVVIACVKDGQTIVGVIHDPNSGETYCATRGGGAFLNGRPMHVASGVTLNTGSVGTGFSNRVPGDDISRFITALIAKGGVFFRNASGAQMLAYVAAGRLIGYYEPHMNAWDCIAGLLMIEEAGGRIQSFDGKTMLAEGGVALAASPDVFDDIKALASA
ncbi:MAG TPA: inositol monophosphatase family protein [Afifellaceae bacterium]|nr:inositol monophosphatase family protein [Afifellaceae bacterium]